MTDYSKHSIAVIEHSKIVQNDAWGAWSLIQMGGAQILFPGLRIIEGNSGSQVPNTHSTPAFNSCTKCVGNPGIIHDCTLDCQSVY